MIRTRIIERINTPQEIIIPGGISGAAILRLDFQELPSAGTVTFERRASYSGDWLPIQNGAGLSVTSGPVEVKFDGGVNLLRATFTGLTGGLFPVLTVVETETANPSSDLLTDGGFGLSRRIRVDPGQTGFFAGRFFRSYIEALVDKDGPPLQFRFTSPVDFILWSQALELTQGAIEMRVYAGATSSGVWTQRPVIGVNRMAQRPQPYYASQCTLETGGNFTGGTEVDLLKIRAAAANNSASNVGGQFSERGLPAGVYHGRFQSLPGGVTVNDDAQMVYSLIFEERPA